MVDTKEYLKSLLSFVGKEFEVNDFDENRSLMYVFESTDRVLSGKLGYSEKSIEILRLVAALNSRRITDKFKIGKKYLQNEIIDLLIGCFYGSCVEKIFVLCFAANGKLLAVELMSEGTVNVSSVIPRQITEIATECDAATVILAHNHPQGVMEPSDADLMFTSDIRLALKTIGVKLTNHYIVAGFDAFDCMDGSLEYEANHGF